MCAADEAAILAGAGTLLAAMGYGEAEPALLAFCFERTREEIRNACNTAFIPAGLEKTAVLLTVAGLRELRRGMGEPADGALRFEPAVKQIQEGDTTLAFAMETATSPEQRLSAFLNAVHALRAQFIAYRRVKW